MLEKTLVVGPFQCNCRILACPRTGQALVIDPGDQPEEILRNVERLKTPSGQNLQVKYLLHTHGHLDHIAATRGLKEELSRRSAGPLILLHRGDGQIYNALRMQAQMFGLGYGDPLPVDRFFEHEEELRVGDLKLTVIHSPGHSPGSSGFRLHEDSAVEATETLYSGDTLFQGSVGRTDLWGADQELMFKMIRERFLTLDGDTRVCPGHGPDTDIATEKRANPFLV